MCIRDSLLTVLEISFEDCVYEAPMLGDGHFTGLQSMDSRVFAFHIFFSAEDRGFMCTKKVGNGSVKMILIVMNLCDTLQQKKRRVGSGTTIISVIKIAHY